MDVMRQDHAFLQQNVRQKNVDDMRRKTSIYVRFAVRTFCGVTMLNKSATETFKINKDIESQDQFTSARETTCTLS
jgi:hypothetical protein